jgi:SHOCT-like domain
MDEAYETERMKILEMIDEGEISLSDGLQLLEALTGQTPAPVRGLSDENAPPPDDTAEPSTVPTTEPDDPPEVFVLDAPDYHESSGSGPDISHWHGWWKYIFWTGAAVMIFGALLLALAIEYSAAGFWYFCAAVPFLLGLGVLFLGWYSRTSRWIHIRVRQPPGEWPTNIALSMPLPIRPTAWFVRVFGRWIPQLDATGLDELITALDQSTTPENPLFVQVQDDEDGEEVEIFIG